ncbi:DUF2927 domain-containing protein [Methylobrevis albus]|uniref:DUF2927 domain-containing protein n=1 Tax=Methylobrevis albus TaxID=2793297 RepID=A0A931I3G9_9HYPH|nr:DUF2927 domain-containing protein [Methylobrevis albus]MBH0238206.1 DUF2927 domain-containing protein [Methylobrevis albus]
MSLVRGAMAHACSVLRRVRIAGLLALGVMVATVPVAAAGGLKSIADAELAAGFARTVFGLEHGGGNWRGKVVKKFAGPVRFSVEDHSSIGRHAAVTGFIRTLPKLVAGVDARLAAPGEAANFRVVIVDRKNYVKQVRADVWGGHGRAVPGQCLAAMDFDRSSITRTTVFIVSDDGEALFRRCMVEEILQGLGPLNDHSSLVHSMFNDRSPFTRITAFDRAIVSMLYDPRVRHGMTMADVQPIMGDLIAAARKRVR